MKAQARESCANWFDEGGDAVPQRSALTLGYRTHAELLAFGVGGILLVSRRENERWPTHDA